MIVCPVCEHAQSAGAECEVCGKLLHGAAAPPPVEPVDGLEPTRHPDVDAQPEPLPDLEPTRHPAADARTHVAPELDLGRATPVDVVDDPVPGLEHATDGLPDDVPTAVPAIVTCRYCRMPAVPGERVCARCGMRLPLFDARADEEVAATRHCACGVSVAGAICPSCGARLR